MREDNYFFHLSRYRRQPADLVRSRALRIEPEERSNEVLHWIEGGLRDFSIGKGILRFHATYWPAILLSAPGNRYIDQTGPWKLGTAEGARDRPDLVLGTWVALVRDAALLLRPLLPAEATQILRRFGGVEAGPLQPGTKVEQDARLFPKRRPRRPTS